MPDLADRIDATRTTQPPPPKRRYRLVLDLDADTPADALQALTEVHETISRTGAISGTTGSFAAGYHFELVDHGEHVTHETFRAAIADWLAQREEQAHA